MSENASRCRIRYIDDTSLRTLRPLDPDHRIERHEGRARPQRCGVSSARICGRRRPGTISLSRMHDRRRSPATGHVYGVRRVCAIWGVARSSFYDARRQEGRPPERPAGRRGPKPALGDADLLATIRRDLARSPWTGEGHRKVWARRRVVDGIRVSRTRVLRIMGENSLLSPHRRPPRPANDHGGSITTNAPNVMWGADGAVIPTVNDGNVTLHRRRALERRGPRLARRQTWKPLRRR